MNAPPLTGRASHALRLGVSRGGDGRSRITDRHVSFPWSVGRGYAGAPGEPILVIPQMAGAGLLAGDRVRQRVHVGANAALHLASAGAMLTYGSAGRSRSLSDWSVELDSGACAFLVSEPYVLLDDADLELRQVLTISPDATFIGCEGFVCAQRGNRSEWRAETVVRRPCGAHLFTDRQRASAEMLQLHSKLDGAWSAFGTVLAMGPERSIRPNLFEDALGAMGDGAWIGQSPMRARSGMCLRIAARDGQGLRSLMMDIVAKLIREFRAAQK